MNAWPYPQTKTGLTADDLRGDHLFGLVLQTRDGVPYQDRAVWRKLRAAEDELERDLHVLLTPSRVISEPTDAEIAAAIDEGNGGNRVLTQRAHDYDTEFFFGDRWGRFDLYQRPVRRVRRIFFAFPNRTHRVLEVPLTWVRLDERVGVVHLVPDTIGPWATFDSFMLSLFAGGRDVPQVIHVDYEAGFTAAQLQNENTDVLEAVLRLAAMKAIPSQILARWADGDSRSVSVDGMSQSRSGGSGVLRAAYEMYKQQDDDFRRSWTDATRGPNLVVA